jgi:diguanylate cyclase (GGDEF)-like protein
MHESFDDLKADLTSLLANEHKSLKKAIAKLSEIKGAITAHDFDYLISEFALMSRQKSILEGKIGEIYDKAVIDVTGLHTKSYLQEFLRKSSLKYPLAYIMGDIDHFGNYNKKYNHLQGDVALRSIAETFKGVVEGSVAGKEISFVARYGGEEFCAFIEAFEGDEQDLNQRVSGIVAGVSGLTIPKCNGDYIVPEGYQKVTMTVAAAISADSENPLSLIKRVDDALINAKTNNNRNTAVILHKD